MKASYVDLSATVRYARLKYMTYLSSSCVSAADDENYTTSETPARASNQLRSSC